MTTRGTDGSYATAVTSAEPLLPPASMRRGANDDRLAGTNAAECIFDVRDTVVEPLVYATLSDRRATPSMTMLVTID